MGEPIHIPGYKIEHARATRALDFFADSDFLRTANLVDTPGTRSVIEQHEQSTQGFLADRLEATTLRCLGRILDRLESENS